jgi:hypothetical protein
VLEPFAETQPTVSPLPLKTGAAETTTNGIWTGESLTFTYQWRRCSAGGTECVNIAGATSSSYTPVAADLGKKLQSLVTATNAAGSKLGDAG